ncbi:tripartite tricarboxylate transporter substrate binding protein [Roseomonas sp. GC11]|uniref:Bug family tripartite tricarboxylate transporter substrate binding protein n=1 Tax=Roseomonas sp. GC11 TaxID=2950546 RepID=UPI00210C7BF7|nr:tripartite tricarboxylate transporter substrate binding protein [Roseomonas sp. GC11]MCQ4159903.1 tripartite tricarboxylate transporter substrate binding protein [Roseomonas sp. GC11]
MHRRSLLAALAMGGLTRPAFASTSYPNRPIRIVVPNPAGGVGDIVSRTLGERAARDLNGQIFVDNRPGGSTTIGTNHVARAEPDGYTILSLTTSALIQTVLQKLPYSIQRDFVPILGVGSFPMALVVSNASGIRSFAQLKAAAARGDGVSYGSGGAGTLAHLAAVRLLNEMQGKGTHVPFRGNPDSLQAMAGGFITMMFPSASEVSPLRAAGQLHALAVTSPARLPSLPDVPTMAELGFEDFNVRLWYAFLAPANTDAAIVTRLGAAFEAALQDAQTRERLTAAGFTPEIRGPQQLARFMNEEARRWGQVVRDNRLSAMD